MPQRGHAIAVAAPGWGVNARAATAAIAAAAGDPGISVGGTSAPYGSGTGVTAASRLSTIGCGACIGIALLLGGSVGGKVGGGVPMAPALIGFTAFNGFSGAIELIDPPPTPPDGAMVEIGPAGGMPDIAPGVGARPGAGCGYAGAGIAPSELPQLRQNFMPGVFSPRHEGQKVVGNPGAGTGVFAAPGAAPIPARPVPQFRQKDDPGGLSWPHIEHRIGP
jgi:hypothetical protein